MYKLFYNLKVSGDVLYVIFEQETKPNKVVTNGNVTALYFDDRLIGINIFKISDVIKLKTTGLIITPDNALIDVINNLLKDAGVATLDYVTDTGYSVMKITKLEEHPIDEKAHIVSLTCGGIYYETVSRYPNLKEGMLVVAVKDGTIKFDGTTFHKKVVKNINCDVELCCGKELKISEEYKEAFVPEGYADGDDFFLGGK